MFKGGCSGLASHQEGFKHPILHGFGYQVCTAAAHFSENFGCSKCRECHKSLCIPIKSNTVFPCCLFFCIVREWHTNWHSRCFNPQNIFAVELLVVVSTLPVKTDGSPPRAAIWVFPRRCCSSVIDIITFKFGFDQLYLLSVTRQLLIDWLIENL